MLLFVPITYIKLQQGMFPMKLTALRSAILLSLIPTTSVIAGGLDRSGQSMSAFFQSGNYAEAGFTVIDPTVEGTSTVVKDEKISDMGDDYYFPSAAIKIQPTDNISLGLFSVHDKFHRTLILSGFCLLKIAKISLNSSFFPKPIKR